MLNQHNRIIPLQASHFITAENSLMSVPFTASSISRVQKFKKFKIKLFSRLNIYFILYYFLFPFGPYMQLVVIDVAAAGCPTWATDKARVSSRLVQT
jgi:hypothetical protein